MNDTTAWQPGDSITLRGLNQKVCWALPVIVVQDTPDLIVLYNPAGVRGKNVDHRPTPHEMLTPLALHIVDFQWKWTDVLFLIVPGDAFCVYLMWETGTRTIDCWYINLQEPIRRTKIGFDTSDQSLDIVVSPDRSSWRWKDEDEFTEEEAIGVYSSQKAQEIRAEGARAIQLFLNERRALYEPWKDWRPNPDWKTPILSSEWDNL